MPCDLPSLPQVAHAAVVRAAPVRNLTLQGITFTANRPTFMEPRTNPSGGDWALEREGGSSSPPLLLTTVCLLHHRLPRPHSAPIPSSSPVQTLFPPALSRSCEARGRRARDYLEVPLLKVGHQRHQHQWIQPQGPDRPKRVRLARRKRNHLVGLHGRQ